MYKDILCIVASSVASLSCHVRADILKRQGWALKKAVQTRQVTILPRLKYWKQNRTRDDSHAVLTDAILRAGCLAPAVADSKHYVMASSIFSMGTLNGTVYYPIRMS